MEKIIRDEVLGQITFRFSTRARHYSLRMTGGKVVAVIPPGGTEAQMVEILRENREKLQRLQGRVALPLRLEEGTDWPMAAFRLSIFRARQPRFTVRLEGDCLRMACPEETDFGDPDVQERMRLLLRRAFLFQAKRLLPPRLETLAARHGLHYDSVRITSSRTRWGSCAAGKRINLSAGLMALPWHLVDFVLLHELCHTVEMNHSARFHALLNRLTDGREQQLDRELKGYSVI